MTLRYLIVLACACGGPNKAAIVDSASPPNDVSNDPCPATPVCPTVPTDLVEGGGLRPTDRCAFPLVLDQQSFSTIIDQYPAALTRVTLSDIATDLNRTAVKVTTVPGNPPGLHDAVQWAAGDESVAYWTPQGVTGSFDGTSDGSIAGRKLAIVSWYYTMANDPGSLVDKGVRLAIADVTNPSAVTYRFALLVSPTLNDQIPSFAPVTVHAGGLAWIGDRLYVPVTTGGFRVFDLSRILKLDGLADSLGPDTAGHYNAYSYAYAIPELERYTADPSCSPRFSFVSLDRETSSLISGEYDATSIHGRLYRWPLAASGDLVRTDIGRVLPTSAWFLEESHIQGGLAHGTTFYLSSSRPTAGAGELDRTGENTQTTRLPWSDSPEDLAFDPQAATIWSLTEGTNARYLFDVQLSAVTSRSPN